MIRELGGDAGEFAARRLTAELVASADLVLGLAQEDREAAVRLRPAALRRCFTLGEFVRLTGGAPEGGGPLGVVTWAAGSRGGMPPAAPEADDIEDPDGRPMEDLRSCAARIDRALRHVAAVLATCEPAVQLTLFHEPLLSG